MKNFKPFGPSIGKSRISRKFLEKLNMEVDTKIFSKSNDYSPKLASQIRKEVQISKNFIKKYLEKELNELMCQKKKNDEISKDEFKQRVKDAKKKAIEENIIKAEKEGNKLIFSPIWLLIFKKFIIIFCRIVNTTCRTSLSSKAFNIRHSHSRDTCFM